MSFSLKSQTKGQQFLKFVKHTVKKNKPIEKKFDPRIMVLQSKPGQTSAHLKVPHSNCSF